MLFSLVFGVDKDVIEVYYHKNIELLCQNLIDIALKHDRYVGQSKKHYLILEMAIASLEGRLPFISLSDLHPIISISQVEPDKTLSRTQLIQ